MLVGSCLAFIMMIVALIEKFFILVALVLCFSFSFLGIFALLNMVITNITKVGRKLTDRNNEDNGGKDSQNLTVNNNLFVIFTTKIISVLFDYGGSLLITQASGKHIEHLQDRSVVTTSARYCGNTPLITEEICSWVRLIIDHHIKIWYSEITSNMDFINDFEFLLEDTLIEFCGQLSRLRTVFVASKLASLLRNHVHQCQNVFSKLSLGEKALREVQNQELMVTHFALGSPVLERCYLKACVTKLVNLVGPKEVISCAAPKMMAIDLLADAIALPLVDLISNPEWINWNIVRLCRGDDYLSKFVKTGFDQPKTDFGEGLTLSRKSSRSEHSQNEMLIPLVENNKPQSNLHTRTQVLDCIDASGRQSFHSQVSEPGPQKEMASQQSPLSLNKSTNMWKGHIFKSESVAHVNKEESSNISFSNVRSLRRSFSCSDLGQSANVTYQHYVRNEADMEMQLDSGGIEGSVDWTASPLWLSNADETEENKVGKKEDETEENKVEKKEDEAEEAVEVGEDVALFANVCIPSTEQRIEPGTGPYTLYKIQYDGLFEEQQPEENVGPSQLARRTVTVLRRFREFHNLQVRLEENQQLKDAIKGFIKPSKWDTILKSSCSKQVVAQRQKFLQKYLQQLCASEPVASSEELQRFLAYGTDAHVAYTRKAPLLPIPRIDKIVMGGMKGAIGIIKATLPNTPKEGKCDMSSMNNIDKLIQQRSQGKVATVGVTSEERRIEFQLKGKNTNEFEKTIQNFLENLDLCEDFQDQSQASQIELQHSECSSSPKFSPSEPRTQGDGCEIDDFTEEQEGVIIEDITSYIDAQLASSFMDIAADLTGKCTCNEIPTYMLLLKIFIGKPLDRWLEKLLEKVTSEELCVYYAHIIHESIWCENENTVSFYNRDDSWKQCGVEEAYSALKMFLMKYVPSFITKQSEEALLLLLNSFQNFHLNRSLIYTFLDCLINCLNTEQKD